MSKGAVAPGYKHASRCCNEYMREKSNSGSVALDNALINLPLQFANYLVHAQQNYDTNYKSMQKMQTGYNKVNLKTHFSPFLLVSQFYLAENFIMKILMAFTTKPKQTRILDQIGILNCRIL